MMMEAGYGDCKRAEEVEVSWNERKIANILVVDQNCKIRHVTFH